MGRLFVILAVVLAGCSAKPYALREPGAVVKAGANEVFVVSHGWHTGLVLPAAAIQQRIPALQERFGDVPYIEFGWGDKGFYQAHEITSGLSVRAIFWPTESVVHAVAVPVRADDYFPHSEVASLCVDGGAFDRLVQFIAGSFARGEDGAVLPLKNGIYGDSQFYRGVGDYYLMNTCNKWTAKGVQSLGFEIDPTFKLTAGSVMDFVRERLEKTVCACRPRPAAVL